jgi:RND family efflux transporter MFP subunit
MGVMDNSELLKELRIDRSAAEPTSRRPLWIGLGFVALLAIGVGAWFALSGSSALPVHTAVAQSMPAAGAGASVLDATGYVTARRSATVSAQITGTLTDVLIEEGDHVKEGQVLARLDDTAQKAQLAQARAQLHAAEATLVQWQAQLDQAKRDWKRADDMVGRKLVSQQAVEQAHTQVETLSAQLATQRRTIELGEAAVRSAEVQLGYCTVHAPFTGVVIAKAAQVGEIVSPLSAGGGFTRTGVGTIVDMDSLEVEVDVNEAYIGRVVAGNPVDSVLNAYPDWRIPSHVIAIIPTADRSKATVKVRIGLDQKDPRIVPDMGVRVSFLEEKKPAAQAQQQAPRGVLVPGAALRKDGDKDVVFVVKEGKAQRRAVSAGGNVGESRQVLAGVAAGETVVVDAPPELKDGVAVKVAAP